MGRGDWIFTLFERHGHWRKEKQQTQQKKRDSSFDTDFICFRVTTGGVMMEMSLSGVMAQPIGWHSLAHVNCLLIVCHMESVIQVAEKFDQVEDMIAEAGRPNEADSSYMHRCVFMHRVVGKCKIMQIGTFTPYSNMYYNLTHSHAIIQKHQGSPFCFFCVSPVTQTVSMEFKCHSSVSFSPEAAGKLRNGQSK